MKNNKINYIFLFAFFAIATTFVFQNCSKVNYTTPENLKPKIKNINSRMIDVNPLFNQVFADMKVLIVVDDSNTMSQSQTRLSNAIDSLINPLFGRNVQFKIVSTSGIPNNQIDYRLIKKITLENGTVVSSLPTIPENYTADYTVSPKNIRHSQLSSSSNFTQAQFSVVKQNLKNAILAMGTNGSDKEEGLCPALRTMYDTSPTAFFKKGDKAAIIILSDEDDTSTFESCVSKYQEKISASPTVYYNYLEQRAKLNFEYQVNRDGINSWIPSTFAMGLPSGQFFVAGQTCNPSDASKAAELLAQKGFSVRNITNCIYEAARITRYGSDLGDNGNNTSVNLCQSQVTYRGVNYPNLYSLITTSNLSAVSGSCEKVVQGRNSITKTAQFTSVFEDDRAAFQMQDVKTAFINKSNELFGSGFIYSAIIHKANDSCALQTGQSVGKSYEDLAAKIPQNSNVESICAPQFSNVLSQTSQYIVNSASRSYLMTQMTSDEIISDVSISRSGQIIQLDRSQYEAVGNILTMINFTLQQGDVMKVNLVKN